MLSTTFLRYFQIIILYYFLKNICVLLLVPLAPIVSSAQLAGNNRALPRRSDSLTSGSPASKRRSTAGRTLPRLPGRQLALLQLSFHHLAPVSLARISDWTNSNSKFRNFDFKFPNFSITRYSQFWHISNVSLQTLFESFQYFRKSAVGLETFQFSGNFSGPLAPWWKWRMEKIRTNEKILKDKLSRARHRG